VSLLVTTFLFKFKENALITAVAAIYNCEFHSRRSSQEKKVGREIAINERAYGYIKG
jgi:hypothetical protein